MTWRIYRHPSESEGTSANRDTEEEVESLAAPSDPSAQLRADLAAAKTEAAEWQDRFLRKAAEAENYRKRVEKERTESVILAKSSVLLEFLPVADACERALQTMSETRNAPSNLEQYQQGIELLYKQVLGTLSRVGVVPIEVDKKKFDPRLHEALAREETMEFDEDVVIQELRRGYLFKDRLLRPAQVRVAVHPKGQDS